MIQQQWLRKERAYKRKTDDHWICRKRVKLKDKITNTRSQKSLDDSLDREFGFQPKPASVFVPYGKGDRERLP